MSRTLERRLSRLEQEAGITDHDYELIECEFSDETKDLMREAMRMLGTLSPEDIEAQVNRKWHMQCHRVAEMSPVERQQRLLAIRQGDDPVARALQDRALNIVPELSPEVVALLDESRATLRQQRAPTA
jgi:hypothetical protein